ncbi:hypothetical protein KQI86_01825 [Clostridium sp. MSJ-11]|uniref:Uncharacterized protein n=1 Tax=Clostridium mobile TaxID=2841512 RepID=A0ABS6ECX4_9CLOT|nr:hypothetical protein [Clostridium mobile]MBU5483045.1 hypothetical protein [Clostridium mobile]
MKIINKNWYIRFKALMRMILADNKMVFGLVFIVLNVFLISISLISKVRPKEGNMFLSIVFSTILFISICGFTGSYIKNLFHYLILGFKRKELINNLCLIHGIICFIISLSTIIFLNAMVSNGEFFLYFNYKMKKEPIVSTLIIFITSFIILYSICIFASYIAIKPNNKLIIFIISDNAIRHLFKISMTDIIIDFLVEYIFINTFITYIITIATSYIIYKICLRNIMKRDIAGSVS